MSGFLLQLLPNLVANWLDRAFVALLVRARIEPPTFRWKYIREVRESIAEMPFLYRSVGLTTAHGFVDIELQPHFKGSMFPTPGRRPNQSTFERVRNTKRGVFIGQAGMGKTTLFRYSILALVDGMPAGRVLNPSGSAVPVYVPLKAIDTSAPSPILRHITTKYAYFGGKRGFRRLIRFSKANRLFLFLDGYDEVPLVGGKDYISNEIRALFANQAPEAVEGFGDSIYRDVYWGFLGCRVWLSSRREFLNANPIDFGQGTILWSIEGIGNRQLDLIQRIFARHREREPEVWSARLNAERFLQQLQVVADGSLEELARNPLFLTIMCFVYVYDLRDEQDPQEVWRHGVDALVNRCIQALLFDVDESKTRGLTDVERDALLARRSAWRSVKRPLLESIAGTAFLNNRAVLTWADLTEFASRHLASAEQTGEIADIRKGLYAKVGTTNIVLQLIYSGLLVLVEKQTALDLYDFPHRKFKEVLARDYLNTPAGCDELCRNVRAPHLAEFIVQYFERTDWQDRLLTALVESIANQDGVDSYRLGRLLDDCCRRSRERRLAADALQLLLETLRSAPRGRLPIALVANPVLGAQSIAYSRETLLIGARQGDANLLRVANGPLTTMRQDEWRSLLEQAWETLGESETCALELLRISSRHCPSLIPLGLRRAWPKSGAAEYSQEFIAPIFNATFASPSERTAAVNDLDRHFGAAGKLNERMGTPAFERIVQAASEAYFEELKDGFEWAEAGKTVVEILSEADAPPELATH